MGGREGQDAWLPAALHRVEQRVGEVVGSRTARSIALGRVDEDGETPALLPAEENLSRVQMSGLGTT